MRIARAKRAKILFFIVKYANLWGFCCRGRRGCLSSLITPTFVDICPPIVSVEKKQSRHKFSVLLFYMEGNQTRLVESRYSDIKKLVANAVPESRKKSTNVYTRFNCDMKVNGRVIKLINPFLAGWYVG